MSRIFQSNGTIFGRHAQQAAPYFSSKTGKPVTLDELQAIFPMELIQQENSQERWIDIPEEVREMYRQWRPSPLYRLGLWKSIWDSCQNLLQI